MAFADYFARGAVAAAQAIAGFEEEAFKDALAGTTVGVALGQEVADCGEGRFAADLAVRLLARLYPTLALIAAPGMNEVAAELASIALAINPAVEIVDDPKAQVGIVIGNAPVAFETPIFIGSDRWLASLSTRLPQTIGSSDNPFGAGAAACFACANVFRFLFVGGTEQLDKDIVYSTYMGDISNPAQEQPELGGEVPAETALVGCGAIGNAAAWALAQSPLSGKLHLIDPESIELSNLQRYVLVERHHVDEVKVDVLKAFFTGSLTAVPHPLPWAKFTEQVDYSTRHALVALDSAADRRTVQASLPEWIVNAWTQPGDLGVSVHGRFSDVGACLSCLYLPVVKQKSEDELVSEAFGIPEHQQQVRQLLYHGQPLPTELMDLVAKRLDIPRQALAPFEGQPIRDLYVNGLCGGAVLPLDRVGTPHREVHVPLAHQSALAGVQLAALFVRQLREQPDTPTNVLRIDVLQRLGQSLCQSARKSDRRCLCADDDFVRRYEEKWGLNAVDRATC